MFSSCDLVNPLYEETPNRYIAIAIDNSSDDASIFFAILDNSSSTISFGRIIAKDPLRACAGGL